MSDTTMTRPKAKRGFGFYARIYRKILVQDLKSKMSYRADFVISTFGMIMTNLSGFVTFLILFKNFPTINAGTTTICCSSTVSRWSR